MIGRVRSGKRMDKRQKKVVIPEGSGRGDENWEEGSRCGRQEGIPVLPQEIWARILARLPRGSYRQLRQVSRAWREILCPDTIFKIREEMGKVEEWMYMGTNGGNPMEQRLVWKALDPAFMKWHSLPNGPWDGVFSSCDRECTVAGRQLLVVGQAAPRDGATNTSSIIYLYDSDQNKWSEANSMNEPRSLFASASFNQCAWVAGGVCGAITRNSAERFSSERREWELLKPMHYARRECSGFFMDKCFYVIGGMSPVEGGMVPLSSAEFYDPDTCKWSLVPDMWPDQMPMAHMGKYAPPLVAVVNDQLFALDASCYELKSYNKSTKVWSSLGKVPNRAGESNGWGLGFKSIEGELWVIGGKNQSNGPAPYIDAAKPDPAGGPPVWRRVENIWNDFILNCAVMKS